MFVGHVAVGFGAKRLQSSISLGTWIAAAMLADLICFALLIAGVEQFCRVPGVTRNAFVGVIPYSHSVLMVAVWGGFFAGAFYLWRRNLRGALLLFAVVLSHWVLDAISHRPDLQLVPGVQAFLGFGLWNSLPATLIVEGGMWVIAIAAYVRATRSRGLAGNLAFWPVAAFLTLAWWGNINRGIDPNPVRAGFSGLIFFSLVILWGYWVNRARTGRFTKDQRAA